MTQTVQTQSKHKLKEDTTMIFDVDVDIYNERSSDQLMEPMKIDTGSHLSNLTIDTIDRLRLPTCKDPADGRTRVHVTSFVDGTVYRSLVYGPVTLRIPVHLPNGEIEYRCVICDVLEGRRSILGMTDMEKIGAMVDIPNQRLVDAPIYA